MRTSTVILLLVLSLEGFSQARTGIYITVNIDMEHCDQIVKLLNRETLYCLSQEPIIEPKSFESIGEIKFDSVFNMRQFKIRLTKDGGKQVSALAQKLPQHKLAIVVDGILISLLNLEGIYSSRTIVIWDEYDSHAMDWIHESLQSQVNKYTKKS